MTAAVRAARARLAGTARIVAYPFAAAAVIAYGVGCVIAAEAGRRWRA